MTARLDLRLPDELHERLAARAGLERRSLNAQAVVLLEGALETERGDGTRGSSVTDAQTREGDKSAGQVPEAAGTRDPVPSVSTAPRSVSDVPVKPWKEMNRLERKAEIARQLEEHDGKD